MPHAVRFDQYGQVDVLEVVEVERPIPGPGRVLIEAGDLTVPIAATFPLAQVREAYTQLADARQGRPARRR